MENLNFTCIFPFLIPLDKLNTTSLNELTIEDCTYAVGNLFIDKLIIYITILSIIWFILLLGYSNNLFKIYKSKKLKNRSGITVKQEILTYRIEVMIIGVIMCILQIFHIIFDSRLGFIPYQIPLLIDEMVICLLYAQGIIFIGFIINIAKLKTKLANNARGLSYRTRLIFTLWAFISLFVSSAFVYIIDIKYIVELNLFKFGSMTLNSFFLLIYSSRKFYILDQQIGGSFNNNKKNNSQINKTNSHTSLNRTKEGTIRIKKMQKQFRIKAFLFNLGLFCFLFFTLLSFLDSLSIFIKKEEFIIIASYDYEFTMTYFTILYPIGAFVMLLQFSYIYSFDIFCICKKNHREATSSNDTATSSNILAASRKDILVNNNNINESKNDTKNTSSIIPVSE